MLRLLFAGARCRVGECLVSAAGLDWPAAVGFTGPGQSCLQVGGHGSQGMAAALGRASGRLRAAAHGSVQKINGHGLNIGIRFRNERFPLCLWSACNAMLD